MRHAGGDEQARCSRQRHWSAGGSAPTGPAQAAPARGVRPGARSGRPSCRRPAGCADRRTVVTGDQAWVLGSADGRFPAAGFHTRGEMGGFWTPEPQAAGRRLVRPRRRSGSARARRPPPAGATSAPTSPRPTASRRAARTSCPDGVPGALVGLTLRSATTRRRSRCAPTRTPSSWAPTPGARRRRARPRSTCPTPGRWRATRWCSATRGPRRGPTRPRTTGPPPSARRSSRPPPTLGQDFRGPQDPAVVCPASGPDAPAAPDALRRHRVRPRHRRAAGLPAHAEGRRADDGVVRRGRVPLRAGRRAAPRWRSCWPTPARRSRPRSARARRSPTCTDVSLPGDPLVEQSVALVQADAGRLGAALRRRRAARGRRRHGLPGAGRDARLDALDRGRLARLHLALRHRRRVHGVRLGGRRAVRSDQGPPADAARRLRGRQRRQRQDRPRGHARRRGLLRRQRRRGQHRRVGQVPVGGRAGVALERGPDSSCATSTRPASGRCGTSPRSTPTATAGPRASATSSATGWARRSSTTPSTRSAGTPTSPTWRRRAGTPRPQRWATQQAQRLTEDVREGLVVRARTGPARTPTRSTRAPSAAANTQDLPAALDRADPDRRRAPGAARARGRPAGVRRARAHDPRPARAQLLHRRRSGSTTPAPARTASPATPTRTASCDDVVSSVTNETSIFTLNSAIAGVSEGNYGRLGADQQGVYIHGNARAQLDPDLWEMPGRDAGDRARRLVRREHRQAVQRALDGHAGLGRVRGAVAGRAPVARRLARHGPRPGRGGPAAAAGPAERVGPKAIKVGSGRLDVTARRTTDRARTRYDDDGRPARPLDAGRRRGAADAAARSATATLDGRKVRTVLTPDEPRPRGHGPGDRASRAPRAWW